MARSLPPLPEAGGGAAAGRKHHPKGKDLIQGRTMRIQRTQFRHPLSSVPRRPANANFGSAFDRLFDDVFQGVMSVREPTAGPCTPRFDLVEEPQAYRFEFEVPGSDPSALEIKVEEGQLLLSTRSDNSGATTTSEADPTGTPGSEPETSTDTSVDEGERVLYRGRRHSPYRAQLRLPEDADTDAIEAEHALGVLTVRVPKLVPESKSRVIHVRHG